jgi:hypothetical protein
VNTIAEESFVFVTANGARTMGSIAFGTPYQAPGGEYVCDVVLDGVDPKPHGVAGGSSLQALLLAVRFAGKRLHDFTTRHGGRVEYVDGEGEDPSVELTVYFGPMLCD